VGVASRFGWPERTTLTMRILQVIASLATRYGGPSVACPAMCRELAHRGHEVSIYTTNVDGNQLMDVPLGQPVSRGGVEVCYFPGWTVPREYKLSPPLWRVLKERIPQFDIVHIYSMYIFSATAAAHLCRKHGVPYLLHPHGCLDPYLLGRHSFRKRLYTALFERRNFQHAAAILFNSDEEMRLATNWLERHLSSNSLRRLPLRRVVPVGVEQEWLSAVSPEARERFRRRYPQLTGRRIVLFFGRLNFKKGMDILARAFVEVAREHRDVHLVLAGPDNEGYGAKVREWLKSGGVLENATFTGPLSGEERFAVLQEAELLVLPSYTENFGQAVAEAMACAVPVVISDRVNIWPEVKGAGAGLVVGCDARQTAEALLALLRNRELGKQMGARGRRWVEENLTWRAIGGQLIRIYEEIISEAAAQGALREPREQHTVS